MSLTLTIDGVDVTDKVRLEDLTLEMQAIQGQVGSGLIRVDDTSGTADYAPAMKEWLVTESLATPTTIAGGFIAEKDIDRGPLTAGVQRQFGPTLDDWNTVLTDRVIQGGKRPEETDRQRVMWLLGTGALGMLDGAGNVPNTNTVTMEEANYRGKTPLDVLDECAESSGKNFFVYWKQGTGWVLYYDTPDEADSSLTSTLQISDLPSEIDNSTIFGASGIEWEQDPERIYSAIFVKYANGWEFVTREATATGFRTRHKTVIRENLRTASRARAWANRQLDKLDTETKRLTLTVSVPGSKLGQLRAGMRIQVKLRSRGITAFTYFRIAGITISPRRGPGGVTDVEYDVRLQMRDRIRPVNIGDIYADPETTIGGGGPSGGNGDTGGTGGTDGGGGTGPTAGYHLLDDWERTVEGGEGLSEIDSATTSQASATSHTVTLPDGCDFAGRTVVVWIYVSGFSTVDTQLDTKMATAGFTGESGFVGGTSQGYSKVYSRFIDGTEGYAGTADTISLPSFTSACRLMAFAALVSGVTEIETSEALPDIGAGNTANPPALDPSWTASDQARWYTVGYIDAAISGDPSGYANAGSVNDGTYFARISAKTATSTTEDPASYTGNATGTFNGGAFTIALRGGAEGPTLIASSSDFSTGASHTLDLPDGCNVVGRVLRIMLAFNDWQQTIQEQLEAQDFTIVHNDVNVPYEWQDAVRVIDGTEGWTGTGDTITVTTDADLRVQLIGTLWEDVFESPNQQDFCNAATANGDENPPDNDPGWGVVPQYVVAWMMTEDDGSTSAGPTGYAALEAIDDGGGAHGPDLDFVAYHKYEGVTDFVEIDPFTTTSTPIFSGFMAMRGTGGSSGWGEIPLGSDVGAPWLGGNDWVGTVASGSADVALTGTTGTIDITADNTQVRETLSSDSPDDPGLEPWGPWAGGDAAFLIRWKVNPLGDTSDSDANVLDFGITTADWNGIFRVHLGDNVNWSWMAPDQQRGFVVLQEDGATASTFVARTLAANTYYYTRLDFRGNRARMRTWVANNSEPATWDIDVAKIDNDGADIGQFWVEVQGNDNMLFTFDSIEAITGSTNPGEATSEQLPPGDGVTTGWTISPWVSGTLRVYVDGILTVPLVVDAALGFFIFDRAPAFGAVIRAEYIPS